MPSHGSKAKEFYTVTEVADVLQLSEKTIYRAIIAGELHAHRFGRMWRIKRGDLQTYMLAHAKLGRGHGL